MRKYIWFVCEIFVTWNANVALSIMSFYFSLAGFLIVQKFSIFYVFKSVSLFLHDLFHCFKAGATVLSQI